MLIIIGTASNDVLHYTNNFTVMGLEGNDSLKAGSMRGGPGDDKYYVVAATNQVIENIDEGTRDYVISGLGSYTLPVMLRSCTWKMCPDDITALVIN